MPLTEGSVIKLPPNPFEKTLRHIQADAAPALPLEAHPVVLDGDEYPSRVVPQTYRNPAAGFLKGMLKRIGDEFANDGAEVRTFI